MTLVFLGLITGLLLSILWTAASTRAMVWRLTYDPVETDGDKRL